MATLHLRLEKAALGEREHPEHRRRQGCGTADAAPLGGAGPFFRRLHDELGGLDAGVIRSGQRAVQEVDPFVSSKVGGIRIGTLNLVWYDSIAGLVFA